MVAANTKEIFPQHTMPPEPTTADADSYFDLQISPVFMHMTQLQSKKSDKT